MSIVFPPNPSLGQTYTYSNITWEYNGFGWNKLTYIPDPLYIEHLNVDFIDFDTTVVGITQQNGRMYWDSNLHTVVLGMTGGINTAIGQSLYKFVHNGSGGPINKGQVVYISGGHASTSLDIELANATSEMTAATTIGVAAENIANGADGFIITQGLLLGVNTNAFSPSDEGKILWLAETDGAFTLTRPQAPSHGVVVGWLVKKAGAGAGSIFVKISNGQEFYELHDVRFTGLTTDNIPAYKGASGIWVNKSLFDLNVARTNQGNTFSVRQVMNAGITSSNLYISGGATFAGNANILGSIILQNGEFLSNSTDGTVLIGPNGTTPSHYSMRIDGVGWGSGVRLGTQNNFNPSDFGGGIEFVTQTNMQNNSDFGFGGANLYTMSFRWPTPFGRNCMTIRSVNTVDYPGGFNPTNSLVFVGSVAAAGHENRVPTEYHVDPTFYIYAYGVTSANDFIRFNHNRINGVIQTGGTSGIRIVPGSGIVGISGGITANNLLISGGATFNGSAFFSQGASFGATAQFNQIVLGNGEVIRDASTTIGVATTLRNSVFNFVDTANSRVYYGAANCRPTGGGFTVAANRVYYVPIYFPTTDSVRQIRTVAQGAVSGNCILGLYSDAGGKPGTKLYETASTLVAGAFTWTTVATNWSISRRGWYWMAVVFSGTPVMCDYDRALITGTIQGTINWTINGRAAFGESEAVGSYSLPSTASSRIVEEGNIAVIEVSFTP